MSCVESFAAFLPVPADKPPPPERMAAGRRGEMRCDCVKAAIRKKGKKEKRKRRGGGIENIREEEVILWATAFQMTGLSWEISVKRARELFSCFPLFRDISCGILLFSVV